MSKPLDTMPAGQLAKAYDKAFAEVSAINRALIDAGRGSERGSETQEKSDPLSLRYIAANDRFSAIVEEQRARRSWHGGTGPIRRT